jgi:putative flippase GtrA
MIFSKIFQLFKNNCYWKRNLQVNLFLKFCIVGVLNTIIGYVLFILFLNWFNYLISLTISYIITIIHSYFWNRFWTFKSSGRPLMEFLRFISVYIAVFGSNALTLFLLIDFFGFKPWMAQLFSLSIVTIISFTGHKYWSFH